MYKYTDKAMRSAIGRGSYGQLATQRATQPGTQSASQSASSQ